MGNSEVVGASVFEVVANGDEVGTGDSPVEVNKPLGLVSALVEVVKTLGVAEVVLEVVLLPELQMGSSGNFRQNCTQVMPATVPPPIIVPPMTSPSIGPTGSIGARGARGARGGRGGRGAIGGRGGIGVIEPIGSRVLIGLGFTGSPLFTGGRLSGLSSGWFCRGLGVSVGIFGG